MNNTSNEDNPGLNCCIPWDLFIQKQKTDYTNQSAAMNGSKSPISSAIYQRFQFFIFRCKISRKWKHRSLWFLVHSIWSLWKQSFLESEACKIIQDNSSTPTNLEFKDRQDQNKDIPRKAYILTHNRLSLQDQFCKSNTFLTVVFSTHPCGQARHLLSFENLLNEHIWHNTQPSLDHRITSPWKCQK